MKRSSKKQSNIEKRLKNLNKLSQATVYKEFADKIRSGKYRTNRKLLSTDKTTLNKIKEKHTLKKEKAKYNITKKLKYNTELLDIMENETNVENSDSGINELFSKMAITKKEEVPEICKKEPEVCKEEPEVNKRTKAKAAANEEKDIALIVNGIKNKNETGIKIMNLFKDKFGIDILDAIGRNNSRKNHYDFDILVKIDEKEVWKHVEHKGSKIYKPIKDSDKPWKTAVQFGQFSAKHFSIGKIYAKVWYDELIASGILKKEFNIKAEIPSYEVWLKKDCMKQAKPETPFGIELYNILQKSPNPIKELNKERQYVLNKIIITQKDLDILISEVLPIVSAVLIKKDYWLTIHGNLSDKFEAKWYPKLTVNKINKVTIDKSRKDLWFIVECDDDFIFNSHLRWGYGQGNNLRIDLK